MLRKKLINRPSVIFSDPKHDLERRKILLCCLLLKAVDSI